jgi:8-oxo-dGTP pyrophosphatase MutT (NUDIX family)
MPKQQPQGVISHENSSRPTDYLYRISIKCLIRNDRGEVLVVKETGRDWWDLPGGGMDHGEDIRSAIAREMREEVNLEGDFTYKILDVEEPAYLQPHDFWQLRLIFEVIPRNMQFSAGEDADKVAFMDPSTFENSESKTERRIHHYATVASK